MRGFLKSGVAVQKPTLRLFRSEGGPGYGTNAPREMRSVPRLRKLRHEKLIDSLKRERIPMGKTRIGDPIVVSQYLSERPSCGGVLAKVFRLVCLALPLALMTVSAQAQENRLEVAPSSAAPGTTLHKVEVRGDNAADVAGYTIVLGYESDYLEVVEVNIEDTLAEAVGAEFVSFTDHTDESFAVLGVLLDLLPPYEGQVIPTIAEFDLVFANLVCNVKPAAAAVDEILLTFEDGLGTPPLFNMFVIGIDSVPPSLVPGSIAVIGSAPFVRGDANGDSLVDIADAVAILNYVNGFVAAPNCLSALDVNDDSLLDGADAIYELSYLFSFGPVIPAPFPSADFDPTPDSIPCDE